MRNILWLLLILVATLANAQVPKIVTLDGTCVKIRNGLCVDEVEFGYLKGLDLNIQDQFDTADTRITDLENAPSVEEYPDFSFFPVTGETGIIYLDLDTDLIYRWDGAQYVLIGDGQGTGDVIGPAGATDNAVARYDLGTGKLLQDSLVTISDAGNIDTSGTIHADGLIETDGQFVATDLGETHYLADLEFYNGKIIRALGGTLNLGDSASPVSINGIKGHDIQSVTTTGSNTTLTALTRSYIKLTGSPLNSVDMIPAGTLAGQQHVIINQTGGTVRFNHNTGATAANRIYTPSGVQLVVPDNNSIIVAYELTEARWYVVGATGGVGGTSDPDTIFVQNFETAVIGDFTQVGFLLPTAFPLNGSVSGSINADTVASRYTKQTFPVPYRFRGKKWQMSIDAIGAGLVDKNNISIGCATDTDIINAQSVNFPATFEGGHQTINFDVPTSCSSLTYTLTVLPDGAAAGAFKFDDIVFKLVPNISALVNLNVSQSSSLDLTQTIGTSADVTGAVTMTGSGVYTHVSGTGVYTLVRDAVVDINATLIAGVTQAQCSIFVNGGVVSYDFTSTVTAGASCSWSGKLSAGATFKVTNSSGAGSSSRQIISVTATAQSPNIVTTNDTFSTDTAALFHKATACLSTEIGCFNTYSYAINTNTKTICGTAPTQTIASMNSNGIQVFTRAYNAASTCGNPARVEVMIGLGFKTANPSTIYKSTGKAVVGSLGFDVISSTETLGAWASGAYEASTGFVIVDSGRTTTTATTSSFIFSDTATQGNGYLAINASKNPAMSGLSIPNASFMMIRSAIPWPTVGTPFIFNTVQDDTHGGANTATGRYTIAVRGKYLCGLEVDIGHTSATGSYNNMGFYVNGAATNYFRTERAVASTVSHTFMYQSPMVLNVGDVVDVRTLGTAWTGITATGSWSKFWCVLQGLPY